MWSSGAFGSPGELHTAHIHFHGHMRGFSGKNTHKDTYRIHAHTYISNPASPQDYSNLVSFLYRCSEVMNRFHNRNMRLFTAVSRCKVDEWISWEQRKPNVHLQTCESTCEGLANVCLLSMTSPWPSQEITSDYIRMTAERHPIYRALVALTTDPSIMDARSMCWWGCVSLRCVKKTRHKHGLSLCQCQAPYAFVLPPFIRDTNSKCFSEMLRHHELPEQFWCRWRRALTRHSKISYRCLIGLRFVAVSHHFHTHPTIWWPLCALRGNIGIR